MGQKNAKKGKKRRVSEAKIAYYWGMAHVPNMLKRAARVLKKQGPAEAQRFVSLHSNGCKPCEIILDAKWRKKEEKSGAAA